MNCNSIYTYTQNKIFGLHELRERFDKSLVDVYTIGKSEAKTYKYMSI